MFVDKNGIWHVMMICCLSADRILLLMQERNSNLSYVGFIINKREKVEFHSKHNCRKKVVFLDCEKCLDFDLNIDNIKDVFLKSV